MDLAALVNSIGLPLIAAGVPLLIAAFKKLLPKIPVYLLPIIAPILGALGDFALSALAGVPSGGLGGALAGLAGVGVREIVDQLKQQLPAKP